MPGTFWIDVADALCKTFLIGAFVIGGGYIVVELCGHIVLRLIGLM